MKLLSLIDVLFAGSIHLHIICHEVIEMNKVKHTLFLLELLLGVLITYAWVWGSHIYINLDRNYAASSYPGDITFSERVGYQIFFPATLFVGLCMISFLSYLIWKKKTKLGIFLIPLICTVYLVVDLYLFLFKG
ncbi:hypothetical protein AB1K83_05510 [Sporosarcina sp. 179-K 3D1 HS]|uniref:hypothetical protein n=1 Tax=Sporosarcina sp. 179-K 3D1 HS TaxID=3232169 RepID=UPI0039A0F0D0